MISRGRLALRCGFFEDIIYEILPTTNLTHIKKQKKRRRAAIYYSYTPEGSAEASHNFYSLTLKTAAAAAAVSQAKLSIFVGIFSLLLPASLQSICRRYFQHSLKQKVERFGVIIL